MHTAKKNNNNNKEKQITTHGNGAILLTIMMTWVQKPVTEQSSINVINRQIVEKDQRDRKRGANRSHLS